MTLGGYICVRNGFENDYCWELAAQSLLPVVDELILCDSDSSDGTREAMDRMAERNKKIKVINYPWPSPVGDRLWWVKWLNFARERLTTELQITLDADEVLSDHPDCHKAIAEAVESWVPMTFNRINFWKDASHLIPEGHAIGKWVTRFGPAQYYMPSDEGRKKGELPILDGAVRDGRLEIFHLGFLRRKEAFWKKARVVLKAFFDTYDERLAAVENTGGELGDIKNCEWTDKIVEWNGYIPDAVQKWMAERGHFTEKYLPMLSSDYCTSHYIIINEAPPTHGPISALHGGDLGDIIYCLAVCRAIGQVNFFGYQQRHIVKDLKRTWGAIEPLIKAMPYIKSVAWHDGEAIDWNASLFRSNHSYTQSLVRSHQLHYLGNAKLPRISLDLSAKWIAGIEHDPSSRGRVIINKTTRYSNPYFRWQSIADHYRSILLFVGTTDEHNAFVREFGPVEYRPTKDLLEVASLIAGADLTIANQSSVLALAEGMKAPRIACMCLTQPDVVVQAGDPTVQRCTDGQCTLPAIGVIPSITIRGAFPITDISTNVVPPGGGWYYPNYTKTPHFTSLRGHVSHGEKMTPEQAGEAIIQHTADLHPDFFVNHEKRQAMLMFRQAVTNAQ